MPVMDNSSEADDDRRGVKRKMALASCDVCETEEAKYRCPSCMKHTCSVSCVKQHKMLSGCSGVRDRTAFVPLAEFSELDLLSDYRFLEDTARLRQRSDRDSVLLGSRRHPKESMWMIRKAKAAKVTLKLLPKMFSKHRENRTVFRSAEGRFHWHLKIHFPQSNAVYSERFPDDKQLDQILNGYIHPSESDPVKRQKLKVYVNSPQEDIRVFLKAEQKLPSCLRYLELDLRKSLQENLMHKTIVEYPEVFVVLKQHSQEFLARIPERSGAVSRDEPQSPAPVAKRPKVIPADDELEDGELRSDEEDGSDEDEPENKVPVKLHEEEELHSQSHEMRRDSGAADAQDRSEHIPGPPDSAAKHEDGGKIDAQRESSSREAEANPSISSSEPHLCRCSPNISSSESHICADVPLASPPVSHICADVPLASPPVSHICADVPLASPPVSHICADVPLASPPVRVTSVQMFP